MFVEPLNTTLNNNKLHYFINAHVGLSVAQLQRVLIRGGIGSCGLFIFLLQVLRRFILTHNVVKWVNKSTRNSNSVQYLKRSAPLREGTFLGEKKSLANSGRNVFKGLTNFRPRTSSLAIWGDFCELGYSRVRIV
jgi:hypothetical protein